MQLLHAYMPFFTEEIYHLIRDHDDDICVRQFSFVQKPGHEISAQGELLKRVITALRDARNRNNIKPKEIIALHIQSENSTSYKVFEPILRKQVNASEILYTADNIAGAIVIAVEKDKFFIQSEQQGDSSALRADLEKDLLYQKNFLLSVQKKLSNERFVQNAKPDVVELERKKLADAEARIKTIEESLENLK